MHWRAPQIELDDYLRRFQSFTNRFRAPYEQSFSFDPLYYSLDIGRELSWFLSSVCCCGASGLCMPRYLSACACTLVGCWRERVARSILPPP